jgi:fructoselysine-6-P-deglycase FrlB-like protein
MTVTRTMTMMVMTMMMAIMMIMDHIYIYILKDHRHGISRKPKPFRNSGAEQRQGCTEKNKQR